MLEPRAPEKFELSSFMAFSLTPSWHDMDQLLWLLEQSGLFQAACRLVWDYLALFQNKRSYLRLVACDVALQLEDLCDKASHGHSLSSDDRASEWAQFVRSGTHMLTRTWSFTENSSVTDLAMHAAPPSVVAKKISTAFGGGWRQLHVNEPRVTLLVKEEARRFSTELSEILSFVDDDYRFMRWLSRASPNAELNHYLPCSCGPVRVSSGPTRRTAKVEYIEDGTDEIVKAW